MDGWPSRFTGPYPESAHFYDYKDQSFLRLGKTNNRLVLYVFCDVASQWEEAPVARFGIFVSGYRLDKNPHLSWAVVQQLIPNPLDYLTLKWQCEHKSSRLPFLKLKKNMIVTKTRCLTWWQCLYLCYFRGFRRNPEHKEVSFIKDLTE